MSGELFPEILTKRDVGDWVWPSTNAYGIPDLLSSLQPRGLELPLNRWGAQARKNRVEGCTFHFYCDDYRFTGLWKDPTPIVNSGCRAIVAPNFSTNSDMPRAVVLAYQYMKMWISRWAQSYGIEVWADLGWEKHQLEYALLGVPKSYRAFATYIYKRDYDIEDWLFPQYDAAINHAGTDEILFLVYGGEEEVQKLCQERGWLWTPAHQQAYLRNVGGTKVREGKSPKLPRQRGNKQMEKGIVIEDMRKTATLMDWC